ncbi:ficolin-3 [Culex quinquefasciatus]|uniref:Ficolin-3 n=1 Tax=Culex quinquefasciatus TaxID=7176 RepID=B0WSA3_CULQU|nr:ficolin-3 [Culex quinquefasciatus]|eukprot:XP_001851606.1 ficolin-3 [Culex quinquefasciatus]
MEFKCKRQQQQHVALITDIEQYECPKTKISGVYKLTPNDTALDRIEVYCDHKLAGGDWIVLHRRDSGALNFTRNWNDYKHGFGDLEGDHWLGLEEMHLLTRRGQYELGVVLTSSTNELWYAFYDWFAVGPERENYTLHLGDYTGGTVHDSLTFHEGKDFSTSDHDSSSGCPNMHASGWWFGHCYEANLNGLYKPGKRIDSMRWNKLSDLGLLGASMMVRKYDSIRGQHEFPY